MTAMCGTWVQILLQTLLRILEVSVCGEVEAGTSRPCGPPTGVVRLLVLVSARQTSPPGSALRGSQTPEGWSLRGASRSQEQVALCRDRRVGSIAVLGFPFA